MRKLMAILALMGMTASSQAATGWFSDYILVSRDGGADEYFWIGADPSFGTQFAGYDFGDITTLEFGADMQYWSDTQDRGGGAYNWAINAGAFTEQVWVQSGPIGNNYQGLLPTTVDVAASLAPGDYTVSVWAKSWDTGAGQGDSFESTGGANFTASFTVVPEPATMALFGLGMLGVVAYRRRQAK